jgi:signal transduction histidine kinase
MTHWQVSKGITLIMVSRKDPFSEQSPYEIMDIERRKRLVLGACKRSIYYSIGLSPVFMGLLVRNFTIPLLIAISLLLGIVPIALISRKFARADRPDLGSQLLIFYLIFMFFTNAILVDGFHALIVPGYLVLVILTGMILPPLRTFQIATVVSVFYLVSQILGSSDIARIQISGPYGEIVVSIVIILAFFVSAISIDMSTRDLRKALDEATGGLVKSNQELVRASEMKSQFTARTSHEIRTPLSSIIVFTDLALREAYGPLNEQLRNALEFVVGSARKLKSIINNILDLSKIDAGELEIDYCPVEIKETLQKITAEFDEQTRAENYKIDLMISDDMPDQIIIDEDRITQIFENLLSNAIKFTEQGLIQVRVDSVDADNWRLQVSDTGKGIPYDHLTHIFEPYYQLEPVPGALKSTGLGLAITQQLVHLMQGEIGIESKLGEGTTFLVTLPKSPDESIIRRQEVEYLDE